jgi:hypothetical protein
VPAGLFCSKRFCSCSFYPGQQQQEEGKGKGSAGGRGGRPEGGAAHRSRGDAAALFLVVHWAMQGCEEEDALQGHGGSVQKKKGAMAAVLQMVRTAHGRRPGQQRLGLAERGVLAAFDASRRGTGGGLGAR